MSYRIRYDISNLVLSDIKHKKSRIPILTTVFFLFFLLLVKAFWVEGSETISKLLWAGDLEVLDQAVKYSINALKNGQALPAAIQTFCRELLYEAQLAG